MDLQERKISKWKEKEELYKEQSFDSSLAELGVNGAFLNAKEIIKEKKVEEKIIENSQLIIDN